MSTPLPAASLTACVAWSLRLLYSKLRQGGDTGVGWATREQEDVASIADTKANALGAGGALELLEHAILLDAARDDDGGRDAEPLVREVNLLSRLRPLELLDLKRMTIDTAKGEACRVHDRSRSAGADTKANTWGAAAHSSEVTALPLSPSHSLVMPSAV